MKIKYIKPTAKNLIDYVIFVIGAIVVLQHSSNMGLLIGIVLMITGREGSIGTIGGEINFKKGK